VKAEEVAEGAFTVAANDHRALFVTSGEGVIALNSFGSSETAREYADAIGGVARGQPIEAVIATIDHLDHSGKTALLASGAEVIAHELCARVIERRGAAEQARASSTVSGAGEERRLAGVDVHLLYPGPSQGTGNLAVFLPQRRVLFVAGPRADARYGLFPDFHLRHVTRIWRELAEIDADIVVPARGPVMQRGQLRRAADYIDALKRAAQEAFAEGVPIWVIQAMEPFVAERLREEFGDLDGFDRHIGMASIRAVHYYLMGGWGTEDTGEPEALFAAG
jgi:glyoxylase-like metal-dependent hydrolase (beta-lactamase superfamily II)